jgi:hypothetical protein
MNFRFGAAAVLVLLCLGASAWGQGYTVYSPPVVAYQPATTYVHPYVAYSPVVAPYATYSPVVVPYGAYSPIVAPAPYAAYAPVYAPAVAVVPGRAVWVHPKVYVQGQPVRNALRAITP